MVLLAATNWPVMDGLIRKKQQSEVIRNRMESGTENAIGHIQHVLRPNIKLVKDGDQQYISTPAIINQSGTTVHVTFYWPIRFTK